MKRILIVALFAFVWFNCGAQELLRPEDALRIGLEHNFGIQLVRNERVMAENNATAGNAGMLPRISLTSNQNFSVNDSRQEFLTGQVNERNNARSQVFNYGAQLNWTIFDGFRMFRRLDQLRLLEDKAELQELLAVEQTIQSIYNQYYSLVLLEKKRKVQEQSLRLSNERVRLATTRLESGSGSRLELLQAQVDRNADSSALYDLNNQLVKARMMLNHTLGRNPQTGFSVIDSIPHGALPANDILVQRLSRYNTLLQLASQDEQMAMLSIRELRARFYPEISATAGYNYLNQQSEAGFLLRNNTSGFTYGLSASWNVFNGMNLRRDISNYHILAKNSELRKASLENELNTNLLSMIQQYQSKQSQLVLEQQNSLAANETLRLAEQRYRIGDLSGIEYREAQRNQLNAAVRLLQTQQEALLLETAIRQMTGLLNAE
ncbi:MAG: TolC family protein [Bacteroidetes bacterium]|nr:TolC family protein [Bacteroidota bacterium]